MNDFERARAFLVRFPLDPFNADVQADEDQSLLVAEFAAVRADEREACAVVAANYAAGCVSPEQAAGAREAAHAIRRRARGGGA